MFLIFFSHHFVRAERRPSQPAIPRTPGEPPPALRRCSLFPFSAQSMAAFPAGAADAGLPHSLNWFGAFFVRICSTLHKSSADRRHGRYALELGRALLAQWPEAWPPPTFWFNSLRRRPDREGIHADFFLAEHEGALRLRFTRFPGPLLLAAWNRLRRPAIETLAGGACDVAHFPGSQIAPSRQAARIFTLHDLYFLRQPAHAHALGGKYLRASCRGRLVKWIR
jgi:hypothetical protein